MSETPQDKQPLEQTVDRKQYHTPEFRDYGTVQDLTQASAQTGVLLDAGTAPTYLTGGGN
jgi:hypothetical protein